MLSQARNAGVAVLVGSMVAVSGVQALSAQCTTQIGLLALGGDLGNCLALSSILGVFSSSQPLTASLGSYLTTLCDSSTPVCSDSTISSAKDTINSACSSDLSGGGANAQQAKALLALLDNYKQVKNAGCVKTSGNNTYCLVNTLGQLSSATGQNATTSSLLGLLTSSADAVTELGQLADKGNLCTDCNAAVFHEALQANSTIATSTLGQTISSRCGDSFGSSIPSSIDTSQTISEDGTSPSGSAASGSASGSASPSGAAAGLHAGLGFSSIAIAITVVTAVIGGAGLVVA